MNPKLKDEKKIDLNYYKLKLIKVLKVVIILITLLTIYHFVMNFKEYRAICLDNDLPVEKYIIFNKTLEGISNEYSLDEKSSNFSSPLESEKEKLKALIKTSIEDINIEVKKINKRPMTKSEQTTFSEITSEYKEITYDEMENYKVSELEEFNESFASVENQLSTLNKGISERILKKEITEYNKKINELSTVISNKNLTSSEKSSYKTIEVDFATMKIEVNNLSENKLKAHRDDLKAIYDRIKQLDEQSTKRINSEQEKVIVNQQQKNESTNNNNSSSVNQKSKTENSSQKQTNEQVEQAASSKTEAAPKKEQSNMCYGTYEEAQQVGMSTMLNDSTIQKMEVNGSTNCIKYYR